MPASSKVPTSYTSRWRTNAAQTTARALFPGSANSHLSASKYNTSCNACRKARVKCSGGKPCRKCAASAGPESCVYSVSRRRGKRKASDGRHPEAAAVVNATPDGDPLDIVGFDPLLSQGRTGPGEDLWPGPLPWPSHAVSFQEVPSDHAHAVRDVGDHSNILPPANWASPPPNRHGEKCPDACFASVHADGNSLISTLNERGAVGLDVCLVVLDAASSHAARYLSCPLCDTGCTRLMTLALTHQRQLNLLCDIAVNPSLYLFHGARATLGAYTPSSDTDVEVKRAMLLGVVRGAMAPVEGIRDRVRAFEERIERGAMEIAEAGRLNLEWLLGISGNLTRRLGTVRAVLEREGWGANAER